jgi:hypothetical protein
MSTNSSIGLLLKSRNVMSNDPELDDKLVTTWAVKRYVSKLPLTRVHKFCCVNLNSNPFPNGSHLNYF